MVVQILIQAMAMVMEMLHTAVLMIQVSKNKLVNNQLNQQAIAGACIANTSHAITIAGVVLKNLSIAK